MQRIDGQGRPPPPLIIDTNKDEMPDLVLQGAQGRPLSVFLGNGDGTFEDFPQLARPGGRGLVSGDFDDDEYVDLAVANPSGSIEVFAGGGDGSFAPSRDVSVPDDLLDALVAADANGDGMTDLITAGTNTIAVLLARGDLVFDEPRLFFTPRPNVLQAFDADGDGAVDVAAWSGAAAAVFLLRGNGDGSFEPPHGFDLRDGTDLFVADLNHDGVFDLINGGTVLEGNLDGTFRPAVTFSFLRRSAAGDLNGDGLLDLVAPLRRRDDRGRLVVFLNDVLPPTSPDCNRNAVPDACDIATLTSPDCDGNGVPDECDIEAAVAMDRNSNGVRDECDPDCNSNDVPDDLDVDRGQSADSNENLIPDECEGGKPVAGRL